MEYLQVGVEIPVCAFSFFIYVFDQVLFCYVSFTVILFSKQQDKKTIC